MESKATKVIAVIAVIMVILTMIAGANAEFYSTLFRISKIQDDIVTVIDCNGMEYQFEGVEDLGEGDWLTAVMDDNGTDLAFDDIIVSIRYERPDLLMNYHDVIAR